MISALLRGWGVAGIPLRTARLRLVAIRPAMLIAEGAQPALLGRTLRAVVPADWPPKLWEPAVWVQIRAQLELQPETLGWHRYMLLGKRPARLIGCLGGFPGAAGDVEIGYSVVDSAQQQGYGTEAADALIGWLLQQGGVRSVSAQAYETSRASVKVMQRCGLRFVGTGDQPGTVRYRRWRGAAAQA